MSPQTSAAIHAGGKNQNQNHNAINRKPDPTSSDRNRSTNRKFFSLSDPFPLYVGLTVAYGLVNGLTSPVLPELANQTSPPLSPSQLGSLFLARGIGSMAGALIIGTVLDLTKNPHTVLAFCLALRLVACVFMPIGNSLWEISLNFALVGFGGNAIYVCGSTSTSWTLGKLMGTRLQFMDAGFGVGGSLSPLLASGLIFVVGMMGNGMGNGGNGNGGGSTSDIHSGSSISGVDKSGSHNATNGTIVSINSDNHSANINSNTTERAVVYGYWVIAGFDILFLVMSQLYKAEPNPKFKEKPKQSLREPLLDDIEVDSEASKNTDEEARNNGQTSGRNGNQNSAHNATTPNSNTENVAINWPAVVLAGCMILLADMCMSSVLFWFYSYTTEQLSIAPPVARLLNTAFWICFTGIQFVWAWLQSKGLKAKSILKFILPYSFVMSCGIGIPKGFIDLGDYDKFTPLLPAFSMCLLGLAAGMNALTTTLLRQHSFIGGRVFAVLRIASACGNMLGGACVGFLHEAVGGKLALPVVAAGSTGLNMVLFLLLLKVGGT